MRKEAVDFLRSQQVLQQVGGQMPMDLNPLNKGKGKSMHKKGKHDGKGINKDFKCYYCGKPGHNKGDCHAFKKVNDTKSIQPDRDDRFAGKAVDPVTGRMLSGKESEQDVKVLVEADDDEENGFIFALTTED